MIIVAVAEKYLSDTLQILAKVQGIVDKESSTSGVKEGVDL